MKKSFWTSAVSNAKRRSEALDILTQLGCLKISSATEAISADAADTIQ